MDLVIEAALEDLALKQRIFGVLDRVAPPPAILATNTSALSVAAIGASANTHRSRVIGLHFFNPAPRMALVEVVRTPQADAAVIDRAAALMRAWGKTPVVCTDSPGFIVNRVNRPFTLEALSLLEAGIASVPHIDHASRDAGFPMGPFELMDLIGVDINLAAARGLHDAMDRQPRFRPSPIQERLVAAGRLGRKTGSGFYRYDGAGRSLGPDADVEGTDDAHTTDEQIVERLVLAIVNEAFAALGDGVASTADIDLALRLGAGHPVGPFERVEDLGGRAAVARRLGGAGADRRTAVRAGGHPGGRALAFRRHSSTVVRAAGPLKRYLPNAHARSAGRPARITSARRAAHRRSLRLFVHPGPRGFTNTPAPASRTTSAPGATDTPARPRERRRASVGPTISGPERGTRPRGQADLQAVRRGHKRQSFAGAGGAAASANPLLGALGALGAGGSVSVAVAESTTPDTCPVSVFAYQVKGGNTQIFQTMMAAMAAGASAGVAWRQDRDQDRGGATRGPSSTSRTTRCSEGLGGHGRPGE